MVRNDAEKLPVSAKEIPNELRLLRMTNQRRDVYIVLLRNRDYPNYK